MKIHVPARILAGVTLLLTALLSLAPAAAQPQTRGNSEPLHSRLPATTSDIQTLRAQAEEQGTVRVVVSLNVDQPGRMPFNDLTEDTQTAVIAQMQDALLAELNMTRSTDSVMRYTNFPMLTLDLSAEQLDAALASGLVTTVAENGWRELNLDQLTANIGMPGPNGAWQAGATGEGQVVAVLDSGIRKNHQFLISNQTSNTKVIAEACFGTNLPDNPNDQIYGTVSSLCPGMATESYAIGSAEPCNLPGEECGHGTHLAGIIAGSRFGSNEFDGVARRADLISLLVFSKFTDDPNPQAPNTCNRQGHSYDECILAADADILRALDYVLMIHRGQAANVDLGTRKIAAVNLSFGGGLYSSIAACEADPIGQTYKFAITQLTKAGVAVVAASGNDGQNFAMDLPACISNVISVGATCGEPFIAGCNVDMVPEFTNLAPFLTFLAPGVNVDSADYTDPERFMQRSGTSQAAAAVSGTIAALRSYRPGASINQLKKALRNSALDIPMLSGTYKRIRVNLALAQLIFPDEPVLLTPGENESFAETPITFKWRGGDYTTKYTLQIFSNNGTQLTKTNVLHETCGPDAEFPDEDLVCSAALDYPFQDDKTYQWRVVAKYDNNNSKTPSEKRVFQFDTPGKATLLWPPNKTTINQPEELFQLRWQEVTLATAYRVTLFDKKSGAVIINTPELNEDLYCDSGSGICTYTPTGPEQAGLQDDRKYKWYVTSIGDDGTSRSVQWQVFAKFPAAPELQSPLDQHQFTSLTDIALTWTEVATATSYRIRIVNKANGKVVVDETANVGLRSIICSLGSCTFTPSVEQQAAFKSKKTYSWTVTAINALGDNASTARTFKLLFPAPPLLVAPEHGLSVSDPAVTFVFTQVPDATSYQLVIKKKANNAKTVKATLTPGGNLSCDGTNCTYTLSVSEQGKLKNNTQYKWFVKSINSGGKGKSAVNQFKFQSPLPATLTSPLPGETVTSAAITFVWEDVGTGATYSVRLKDKKTGKTPIKATVPGGSCTAGSCSYTLNGSEQGKLKNNRTYKWWVVATNSVGTSKSPKQPVKTQFP